MDVQGIANGLAQGLGRVLRPGNGHREAPQEAPRTAAGDSGATTSVRPSVGEGGSSVEERGVIRNLLNNHFSSVADARLRINFHEQLQITQQASFLATVEDGVNSFMISVEVRVEVFIVGEGFDGETVEAITTALDSFMASVRDSLDSFLGEDGGTVDTLFDDLMGSLQQFIDELISIVAPGEPSTEGVQESGDILAIVQTTNVVEITGKILSDSEAAPLPLLANLEQLINDLNEFLSNTTESISTASTITSTSTSVTQVVQSTNNGVALERFLSILEALEGNDGTQSILSETSSPVDIL